jgi:hypothetical protein
MSGSVIRKRRQEGGNKIACLFLDQDLRPFIRPSQPQIRVDAVYGGLLDALDVRLECCFAARLVHVTDDHAQDFLNGDLPGGIDRLYLFRILRHVGSLG